MEFTREILDELGAAFPDDEIEFLPRATSGGKALGLPYIDARSVMRRLDAVVGPEHWSFDFDLLSPDGKMVKGKLTVCGVTKCDAGEANQEDEVLKSAVSDALKRCAVHFGIGRYLYYLPKVWAPYDGQRRQFSEPPRLAPAAIERALGICGITAAKRNEGRGERVLGSEEARGERREANARRQDPSPAPSPLSPVPSAAPESSGDRAASRLEPAAPANGGQPPVREAANRTPAPAAPEAAPQALVCSGSDCGKALTKGQHDVSVRAFGQPLCPACQKEHARKAAAA